MRSLIAILKRVIYTLIVLADINNEKKNQRPSKNEREWENTDDGYATLDDKHHNFPSVQRIYLFMQKAIAN